MIKALTEKAKPFFQAEEIESNYVAPSRDELQTLYNIESPKKIDVNFPVENKDNKTEKVEEEYLELSSNEIELIQDLSEIIGNNPRGVKRFINVYKIVKAHEGLIYKNDIEDKEFLILMFLLAIPIGPFKNSLNYLYDFFSEASPHSTLQSYISECITGDIIFDGNPIILDQASKTEFKNFHQTISRVFNSRLLFYLTPQDCKSHLKFIRRFTFADVV